MKGYTLTEMIIALTIIGILSAIFLNSVMCDWFGHCIF